MSRLVAVAVAAAVACSRGVAAHQKWKLTDLYDYTNFFDKFDFVESPQQLDPASGHASYVGYSDAVQSGLIAYQGTEMYMGVDHFNQLPDSVGRKSVRIESKNKYNHALIVGRFTHLPEPVCGSWPSFFTYGDPWPKVGEIDMLDQWNDQGWNEPAVHTGESSENGTCTINDYGQLSPVIQDDCDNEATNDVGCTSYEETGPWGQQGGGVYALEWTDKFIKLYAWRWNRLPENLDDEELDTACWGQPSVLIENDTCDVDSHFADQKIVLNMNFCGATAGNQYIWESSCAATTGYDSCAAFVAKEHDAFADVFFKIKDIRVYTYEDDEEPAATTTSSAAPAETTTSGEVDYETTSSAPYEETTSSYYYEETTTTSAPYEEETTTSAPYEEETTTSAPYEEETTTSAPYEETTTSAPYEEETTTSAPYEEESTTSAPYEETTTSAVYEETTSAPYYEETTSSVAYHNTSSYADESSAAYETTSAGPAEETETASETETEAETETTSVDGGVTSTSMTYPYPTSSFHFTNSSTPLPTTTVPPSYTTSTVTETTVYTITSCAPEVPHCPIGSVTTSTVAIYTTVCPVSEEPTTTAVPTEEEEEEEEKPTWTTTTVTTVYTVTQCPKPHLPCEYHKTTETMVSSYTVTETCTDDEAEATPTYTAPDETETDCSTDLTTTMTSTLYATHPTPSTTETVWETATVVPTPSSPANGNGNGTCTGAGCPGACEGADCPAGTLPPAPVVTAGASSRSLSLASAGLLVVLGAAASVLVL